MAATMTNIAKKAGVSVAVVSRLLRGDPTLRVSEKRRKQILRIKDEMGGVIAHRKKHTTQTIIAPINRMFSTNWVNTHWGQNRMIQSIEETLQKKDFHLHFVFFDPVDKEKFFASLFHSGNRCDGALLLSRIVDDKICDLVRQYNFPHVATGGESEQYRVNTVRPNTSEGIRDAIVHLQSLGHKKIGYLGVRNNLRYQTFVAIMMSIGLPVDQELSCFLKPLDNLTNEVSREILKRDFNQWLDSNRTTALICQDDNIALEAIEVMKGKGMDVGKDLSLVGHDNLEEKNGTDGKEPILTTIDTPSQLIGQRVAELLLNQILHNQTQLIHERLPVKLIVRKSTGPCPS